MRETICRSCRAAIGTAAKRQLGVRSRARHFTTTSHKASTSTSQDIASILSKPTWSVRDLLPSETKSSLEPQPGQEDAISPEQLSHLLRLSALPQPRDQDEEKAMLATLHSQLHFVRAVRAIDTSGVEPLAAIRDETAEGKAEATIGLEQLQGVLDAEEKVGIYQRPKRRGNVGQSDKTDGWDPLATAARAEGRFFVVKTGGTEQS